jgi:hypothetical protein
VTRRVNPILALVGAIVVIDVVSPVTITAVLRRNRAEAYIGLAWLAVHIGKQNAYTARYVY